MLTRVLNKLVHVLDLYQVVSLCRHLLILSTINVILLTIHLLVPTHLHLLHLIELVHESLKLVGVASRHHHLHLGLVELVLLLHQLE